MKGQVMAIYQHIRHPRIAARRADRPVKVADLLRRDSAVNRFNTKVAIVITRVVGSMWCAYAFALFDLISLPAAIRGGGRRSFPTRIRNANHQAGTWGSWVRIGAGR
jgi:hypothetical protein